jgi:UDP-glucose 4-epimerase
MSRRVPDTRKLAALTGWRPARTLDDAILDTIAATRAAQTAATSGLVTS